MKRRSSLPKGRKRKTKTIQQLLEGKPWRWIVEALPEELQKKGYKALIAFEESNLKRLELLVAEMRKEMPDVDLSTYRMVLANLRLDAGEASLALQELEALLREVEPFPVPEDEIPEALRQSVQTPLEAHAISQSDRLAKAASYCYLLATGYYAADDKQLALGYYEYAMPYLKMRSVEYGFYFNLLVDTKNLDSLKKIANEKIQQIQTSCKSPEDLQDVDVESAILYVYAFFALLECAGYEVDPVDFDPVLEQMMSTLSAFPDEIRQDISFKSSIARSIIRISEQMEKTGNVECFRRLLDRIEEDGLFCAEHDPEKKFADLIPSGYWSIETWYFDKEYSIEKFIRAMLGDIVRHIKEGAVAQKDPFHTFLYEMSGNSAKWDLARYCSEVPEREQALDAALDLMREKYPRMWELIADTAPSLQGDQNQLLEELTDKMTSQMRGKYTNPAIVREELEASHIETRKEVEAALD